MTWVLVSLAVGLWIVALWQVYHALTRRPNPMVSQTWLAESRRRRDEFDA
jgi:hypothetical protein